MISLVLKKEGEDEAAVKLTLMAVRGVLDGYESEEIEIHEINYLDNSDKKRLQKSLEKNIPCNRGYALVEREGQILITSVKKLNELIEKCNNVNKLIIVDQDEYLMMLKTIIHPKFDSSKVIKDTEVYLNNINIKKLMNKRVRN